MSSRATSAAAAAAAAVVAGRNYNSTHHADAIDEAAAAAAAQLALSMSSFHLQPEAAVTQFHLSTGRTGHPTASSLSLSLAPFVRPSVCASVCLILDMRTQYSSPVIAIYFASPTTAASSAAMFGRRHRLCDATGVRLRPSLSMTLRGLEPMPGETMTMLSVNC